MPYNSGADWRVELVGSGGGTSSVEGTTADGAAFSGKPVIVGGVDGSGNAQTWLVDTSGRGIVVGAAADGAAVAGNPLLMGASDGTNARSLLTANAANATTGAGLLGAGLLGFDGTNYFRIFSQDGSGDGTSTVPIGVLANAQQKLYNGLAWDRERNNVEVSLLASAARTANPSVSEIVTYNARGLLLIVEVTSITATPVVTPSIQARVPASSSYVTLWSGLDITATGIFTYLLYPGASDPAAFTQTEAVAIGRRIRPQFTHVDGDSITYSADLVLLV